MPPPLDHLPALLRPLAPCRPRRRRHPPRTHAAASVAESGTLCVGLAAALAIILVIIVYPTHFFLGDAARFHNFVFPNDAIDYRLAWQALVERGRSWPSLWTDLFNYPRGFPVSLLDALPLAATVFRPLVPWLPPDFHYFGLWHAVATVLQAVAGAILVRAAGIRHVVPCLAAAAFAVAMPIFVGRLNWTHVALSTQGLLILSLALCVHASRARPALSLVFPQAAALSLVSLAVHPLLALQVLFFGLLATAVSNGSVALRAAAAVLLCALFAALCHALGIFAAESFLARQGLGAFGFSPWGMIVGEPDSLRELYDAPGPGIEQDAWLGWGCVLLAAAGVAFRPRFRIPRHFYPLAAAVAFLAIIAVSPWIRVGTSVIDLSFLLPDAIIDLYAAHRATVRLAWPLVMCLGLLALAHFFRRWPRNRAAALVGIALALQVYSIWPYWAHEHIDSRLPVMQLAALPDVLEGGSVLVLLDPPNEPEVAMYYPRYAMYLAVESGLPLMGGAFSRPPPSGGPDREGLLRRESGVRYLVPIDAAELSKKFPQISDPAACIRWEVLLVCPGARDQNRERLSGIDHGTSS